MAVSASPVRNELLPASPLVEMRAGSVVRAGTHREDAEELVTGWHTHELHQLQCAFEGTVEVETASARYLLPPRQAAWIPAGLPHQTTLRRVRSGAVFFDPAMVPGHDDRVRVLAALPPVIDMVAYAMRWPITRSESDRTADAFFEALALLTAEWLDTIETPLWLPTTDHPTVAAAMDYVQQHLAAVTSRDVSRAVGCSERSLRRWFVATAGMTFEEYRTVSRLLRAMTLLPQSDRTVLDIATGVGFASVSTFNRAFRQLAGEAPGAYRRRICGERASTGR